MNELRHLRFSETLRLQLIVDLQHGLRVRTWVRAEDPIPLGVARKTLVVAPFVRNGDQPIRCTDVDSVIRQRPQELGIRRVGVRDSSPDQYSSGSGKNRTEWMHSHR